MLFRSEVRVYNPHEKKLDFRTTSGYFIGYPKNSKGCRFYCPNHSTRIVETRNVETRNVRFIENGEISGSDRMYYVSIQEVGVEVPIPKTDTVVVPQVTIQPNNNQEQQTLHDEPIVVEPQAIAKRSQRDKKSVIFYEYVIYLQES